MDASHASAMDSSDCGCFPWQRKRREQAQKQRKLRAAYLLEHLFVVTKDKKPVQLALVRSILDRHPELLQRVWSVHDHAAHDASIYLHHALRYHAPLDVIQYCTRRWPMSLRVTDSTGNAALHVAVANRADAAIVAFLMDCEKKYACLSSEDDGMDMMIQRRNSKGMLPLHVGLADSSTASEIIRLLTEAWPASVYEVITGLINHNLIPLHQALQYRCTAPVIRILVEVWPDSVSHENVLGAAALQMAIETRAALEVLQVLVQAKPSIVRQNLLHDNNKRGVAPSTGYFPLHHAMEYHAPLSVIAYLVSEWPQCLSQRNAYRYDPASSFRCAADVVAAFGHSVYGNLPLHFALNRRQWRADVIQWLVQSYRGAISVANDAGHIPLQIALRRNVPFWLIESLVDQEYPLHFAVQYPDTFLFCRDYLQRKAMDDGTTSTADGADCMRRTNAAGETPLYMAARCYDPTYTAERYKMLVLLHSAWPESIRKATNAGNLPLHGAILQASSKRQAGTSFDDYAYDTSTSAETMTYLDLEYLVKLSPSGLRVRNHQGHMPLHLALQHGCPVPVVQLLLQLDPGTAVMQSGFELFPWQVAILHRQYSSSSSASSLQMIYDLIRPQPDTLFDWSWLKTAEHLLIDCPVRKVPVQPRPKREILG